MACAEAHWYAGILARRWGEFALAEQALQHAVDLSPDLAEARVSLAWLLADRGALAEAYDQAEAAVAAGVLPHRLAVLGWVAYLQGNGARALKLLTQASDAAPQNTAILRQLTIVLIGQGLAEAALARLTRSGRPGLQTPDLYEAWGDCLLALKQIAAAGAIAADLIAQNPAAPQGWRLRSAVAMARRDMGEEEACLIQLASLLPDDMGIALRHAALLERLARRAEAIERLSGLYQRQPLHAGLVLRLAHLLTQDGQLVEARQMLVRRLRQDAANPYFWAGLAETSAALGKPRIAQLALRRAQRLGDNDADIWRLSGWLLLDLGKRDQAIAANHRLRELLPEDAGAAIQAATLFLSVDQQTASNHAERAIFLDDANAQAWIALGHVRGHQHWFADAERCFQMAVQLDAAAAAAWRGLAWIYLSQDRLAEAVEMGERALALDPAHAMTRIEFARILQVQGKFDHAIDLLSQGDGPLSRRLEAVELLAACLIDRGYVEPAGRASDWARAAALLIGVLRRDLTRTAAATSLLRLAAAGQSDALAGLDAIPRAGRRALIRTQLELAVANAGAAECQEWADFARQDGWDDAEMAIAGLYITAMQGQASHEETARGVRRWSRRFATRTGQAPPVRRPPNAKVRVAYLAPYLHGSLLLPVLSQHDRERFEIVVYTPELAEATPLRGLCQVLPWQSDKWPATLAANRFDVVVDTIGLHPFISHMPSLAALRQRVAPVQCGWLGATWATAGGLYDALFLDENTIPTDQFGFYDEEVVQIPGGQWGWTPIQQTPDVGPLPCVENGYITFGVTTRGFRFSGAVMAAWAEILCRLPTARLRIMGAQSRDWRLRSEFGDILAQAGVDPARIEYRHRATYVGSLDFFQDIDIALDCFPGNGGLSNLDALWMGVPVIARAGTDDEPGWAALRQGASILGSLGVPDWNATDTAGYIDRAVALAQDVPALADWRRTLRSRMQASPLCDGRRVARVLEQNWLRMLAEATDVKAAEDASQLAKALGRRTLNRWLGQGRRMSMPALSGTPAISVILTLRDDPGAALQALRALGDQTDCALECLVIDVAPDGRMGPLLETLDGVTVLRGASLAEAVAVSKGRYLLLLAEDIQLLDGSLNAAVSLLDREEDIGILGGLIIGLDGKVEAAGGVIFGDGEMAGYGAGDHPDDPAFRYRRAVDFCSGDLMAIRSGMLGSDRVAEPLDLSRRIRAAGGRVIYEPGLQAGRVAPRSAPAPEDERPRLDLPGRPRRFEPGAAHRLAAGGRPRVLLIDNAVPYQARGAGLPRARHLIDALAAEWHVTLYPLWQYDDAWATVYRSLPSTIEVVLGRGYGGLEEFLEQRLGSFDAMVVSRPDNMRRIDSLRDSRPDLLAGIPLVYDAEALFSTREIQEAALKDRPLPEAEQRRRRQNELDLARSAAGVLCVSAEEAALFEAVAPGRVAVASHGLATRRTAPGPEGRADLLFIGALAPDTPNEDGLLWFVDEVLPRLTGAPILSIVGECRSEKIAALAGPQVRLLGRVDDLDPLYDAARVFIAPARYAAGVAAKVIEAACNGVPVVASEILVRQLGWQSGVQILGAPDATRFAAGIDRLLADDDLWRQIQADAWVASDRQFNPDLFRCSVLTLLRQACPHV
jgi:predicted O-linked N-acetylglucosamine transferase (SPINDLY family)/predicted Zn-dependent protease/glycosyltransferase involved in cell wall biosynthesis